MVVELTALKATSLDSHMSTRYAHPAGHDKHTDRFDAIATRCLASCNVDF